MRETRRDKERESKEWIREFGLGLQQVVTVVEMTLPNSRWYRIACYR